MEIKKEKINGLISIQPKVFVDNRGLFFENFNELRYKELIGSEINFVQDNISISSKGVLRGLHFQVYPYEQGKLVSVLSGSVIDVAVDIRKDSPTFGEHIKVHLSANKKNQLWIPPGFAHGFYTLEENTIFSYKCTNYYSQDHEMSIRWDDPDLKIDWGINNPIVSIKDNTAKLLKDL